MPTLTARTPALSPTPTAPAARRPAPRALVALLLAVPARRLAQQCMRGLDAWRQRRARRRADAHFLAVARRDARLMGDLRGACDRDDTEQAVAGDSRTGHAVPGARGHTLHYL